MSRKVPEACPFLGNPDFTLRTLGGHLSHFPRKKWSIGARIRKCHFFRFLSTFSLLDAVSAQKMTSPDTISEHFLAKKCSDPGIPGISGKSRDFLGFPGKSGISRVLAGNSASRIIFGIMSPLETLFRFLVLSLMRSSLCLYTLSQSVRITTHSPHICGSNQQKLVYFSDFSA